MEAKTEDIVEKYVGLWNEPDPEIRSKTIRDLWAEEGAHKLEPPQSMGDEARTIGMPAPTLELSGYEQLEARVARAHEEFVAPGGFVFRSRGNGSRLDDVVKFNWEMVPTGGGDVVGVGLDILVLDGDGRILVDYQFIEELTT
jgi:hypothetical protein